MRTFLYWLTVTAVAVLAAGASAHERAAGQGLWETEAANGVLPVPEPSLAVLLGVGIMAVAFTYRRAWLNYTQRK